MRILEDVKERIALFNETMADKERTLTWKMEDGLYVGGLLMVLLPAFYLFIVLDAGTRVYALNAFIGLGDAKFAAEYKALHPIVSFGALFFTIGLAAIGGVFGYLLGANPGLKERHYSGINFMKGIEGIRAIRKIEGRQIDKEKEKGALPGLFLGECQISRQREVGHIVINGLPGGGKTVFIKSLLKQIYGFIDDKGAKCRLVIHDPKGDFTAFLRSTNKNNPASLEGIALFAPWDERSVWWDISADITDSQLAQTFAKNLFSGGGQKDDSIWTDTSRELFGGVLAYLIRQKRDYGKPWGWKEIADIVAKGGNEIVRIANLGDPNTVLVAAHKVGSGKDLGDDKTLKSIMTTIGSKIGWIGVYANASHFEPEKRFSLTEWLKGDDDRFTLILQNNLNYEARAQQIFGSFLQVFSSYANSSSMPEVSADHDGIYMILDEYPQLGKAVSDVTQKLMELGRSRGIRVLFAMQDESQLDELFGRDKGRTQRSLQQTRVYCKSALETSKDFSTRMGNKEIKRFTESRNQAGKIQVSEQVTTIPVVRQDEISGLALTDTGAEIILGIDDILVKTVAPFTTMNDVREKVVESQLWKEGLLNWARRIEEEASTGSHIIEEKAMKDELASMLETMDGEIDMQDYLDNADVNPKGGIINPAQDTYNSFGELLNNSEQQEQ